MEPISASAPEVSAPGRTALDPASILEVDHYELDGIPLFHLPMAGPTILVLAFRAGRADEPVVRGGLTHLAEHLVLTKASEALDHTNGTTEPFRVTFVHRGSPDDVARFLRDVSAALSDPPLHRMHEEVNVLRTEAAGRQGGMGMSLKLLWFRTGYQGIGAVHLPEFFLRNPDEAVLRDWIGERFVAGNAVIWIAGELPAELLVTLPPGPRQPSPEIAWIPGFDTPALASDDVPGIGVSFFVERTTATATALRSLDRQLRRALRVDRGLGYEVGSEYIPVSADRALATHWTTCLPEATRDVQRIVLETIDDIAARGPTPEELDFHYQERARMATDPLAIPARLDAHATSFLLGELPPLMSELLDEQWRLEPGEVAAAFRQARESMLLLLPPTGVDPQRPFKPFPGPWPLPVGRGRTFEFASRERGSLFGRKKQRLRLSVGEAGVAVDAPDGGRVAAVPWADCVAVVRDADARMIIGRDGILVPLIVGEWKDGRAAAELVDRMAPPQLLVPIGR